MKKMRRSIVDTRESLKSETDLVGQVEGVGRLVSTCVDALQEEVDECRRDELSPSNLTRIHELQTLTMEVETVYIEYTTVVQHVSFPCRASSFLRLSDEKDYFASFIIPKK